MERDLIIVESPRKGRSLGAIVGTDHLVLPTVGHIYQFNPSSVRGGRIRWDQPVFRQSFHSKSIRDRLRSVAQCCRSVAIATDSDLAGEAIAAHVAEELSGIAAQIRRIHIEELTAEHLNTALVRDVGINRNRVAAYETMRIVDRLVARSIRAMPAGLTRSPGSLELRVLGHVLKGTRADLATPAIGRTEQVQPLSAHNTATLLHRVCSRDGISAVRAMAALRALYEGIDLGRGRRIGLVSYPRTTSRKISESTLQRARREFGDTYSEPASDHHTAPEPDSSTANQLSIGHGAIVPLHFDLVPDKIEGSLTAEERIVYAEVYRRAVCVLAPDSPASRDEDESVEGESHEREYCTEGQLISDLASAGIGTPAGWTAALEMLYSEELLQLKDGNVRATSKGEAMMQLLERTHDALFRCNEWTRLEDLIRQIAAGRVSSRSVLEPVERALLRTPRRFRTSRPRNTHTGRTIESHNVTVTDDISCPECRTGRIVLKINRRRGTEFFGCSRYPECTFTSRREPVDERCPSCGHAWMERSRTRGGVECPVCREFERRIEA